MAAGFFYVYGTALVVLEALVGIAFGARSRAESSRKMAFLAIAYAWSAPLVVLNVLALPGMPPNLQARSLEIAPAIWVLWHIGWPIALLGYAVLPERLGTRLGALAPVTFLVAVGAGVALIAGAAQLPIFVTPSEVMTPAFHVGIAAAFVLDVAVSILLVRAKRSARDAWVLLAVALAALESLLMLVSEERFSTPYYLSRLAGVTSACAMLGALLADGLAVVRRAALATQEVERVAEFRTIADAMPQIVWQINAEGRNIYTNARWGEYTGRDRTDGSDATFKDAIHPDDRPGRDAAFTAARAAGTDYEATYRLRGADGAYRYFLTRAVAVRRDGNLTHWVGTSTDIDERRRRELEQASAYERQAADAGRMRSVAAIGRALSESLDLDVVLARAVEALVPQIGDWALLTLRNDAGELEVAAVSHRDPQRERRLRQLVGYAYAVPQAKGGSAEVFSSATGLRVAEVTAALLRRTVAPRWFNLISEMEPRSVVVVPLLIGGIVHGTLKVVFAESGRAYESDDLEMLEEVGRRVALSIDNARHYTREHRVAERLQRASLPANLPRVAGVVLDAVYQAGKSEAQIGGDWYDAFRLEDGRLVVSVGDVMGSGLEAAVTMGAVRQAIRGATEVYPDPVTILNAADRALEKMQGEAMVTAFLGIIDPTAATITYASAGHPPPFVRRADGSIAPLEGSGLPIGLRRLAAGETSTTAQLEDDALIVLYTDGLTEAQRDIASGETRVIAALEGVADCEHPAEYIRSEVLGCAESVQPRDDVAILTVRLTAVRHRRRIHLSCDVRDVEAVRRARRTVSAELQRWGLSDSALFNADLTLGELLGNVARHAPPTADISLDLSTAAPVLSVLDRGPGCRNAPSLPNQDQEWGRGLFLASKLASELIISDRPGGGCSVSAALWTDVHKRKATDSRGSELLF